MLCDQSESSSQNQSVGMKFKQSDWKDKSVNQEAQIINDLSGTILSSSLCPRKKHVLKKDNLLLSLHRCVDLMLVKPYCVDV